MISRPITAMAAVLITTIVSSTTLAQTQGPARGTFDRLQKVPMTLFDAGMKSLRRLALDTAAKITETSGMETTASVGYKHAEGIIDIAFNLKSKSAATTEALRQECGDIRKNTILKMFRIGLTDYGTNLSVPERIRRRIGGQFAPEPTESMQEIISLGEQLGQVTYFTVNLTTLGELPMSVSCRARATESAIK